MSESEETTEKEITIKDVFDELIKINKRLDSYDAQFEAIRSGIVANSADFDRLTAKVLNLSADVKNLTEEVRHMKTPV